MRIITIQIQEYANGSKARIKVDHSNDGIASEVETATASVLNMFLKEKVQELDPDGEMECPH